MVLITKLLRMSRTPGSLSSDSVRKRSQPCQFGY